jgi:hypothetical protein
VPSVHASAVGRRAVAGPAGSWDVKSEFTAGTVLAAVDIACVKTVVRSSSSERRRGVVSVA